MKSAGAFLEWLLVGGLFSLAFVGMLTIGPYVLVVSLVALLAAAKLIGTRVIMALVSGLGLVPLWVAWNNRRGPGEECGQTATAQGCSELYDPRPWAAVGVGLVIVGVVLAVMVHRTRREPLAGGGSDKQ